MNAQVIAEIARGARALADALDAIVPHLTHPDEVTRS